MLGGAAYRVRSPTNAEVKIEVLVFDILNQEASREFSVRLT